MADKQQDDQQLREEIRGMAAGGRAACKGLLELAERTNVSPGRIGQLCNEMDIRVAGCQLGCFR